MVDRGDRVEDRGDRVVNRGDRGGGRREECGGQGGRGGGGRAERARRWVVRPGVTETLLKVDALKQAIVFQCNTCT